MRRQTVVQRRVASAPHAAELLALCRHTLNDAGGPVSSRRLVHILKLRCIAAVMVCSSLSLAAVSAQDATRRAQTPPMTPRPAYERLGVFEGTWTLEGSPPEREFIETCNWMPEGRRHLMCRTRYRNELGPQERMAIYSYRASDSTYLVYALMRTGEAFLYAGRSVGDRWVMDFLPHAGDLRWRPAQRVRMVITVQSDTIRFVEESSENGGPWQISEDYRYVRVRASNGAPTRRP